MKATNTVRLALKLALLAVVAVALALPGAGAAAAPTEEVKKLTASDTGIDDDFGLHVALSGGTTIVSARYEAGAGTNRGAAYVFRRDQGGAGNWGEVRKLTASDAEAGDVFGVSVAVSGDTAIVGAFLKDAGGSDAGAAYVFERDQGGADNWGEVTKLLASDVEATTGFGISVAVSGDTAVVGAYKEDTRGSDAVAAYVFAELPDVEGASLETGGSSGPGAGVVAGFAAAIAAAVLTLGGAAWYARRRRA